MLTLYVEGIPAIRLGHISEIPARQGSESWKVVDATGKVIAAYLSPAYIQQITEKEYIKP